MNQKFYRKLDQRLQQQHQSGLWREQKTLTSPQGPLVLQQGQTEPLVNFSSNDYLSLASHPELIDALHRGAAQFGIGSGASHLICGHSDAHLELQTALAEWLGYESVTLFSCGYMANLAMLQSLFGKSDRIVQDKLNHASLIDGARASEAEHKRFQHCSVASLQQQLSCLSRDSSSRDSSNRDSPNKASISRESDDARIKAVVTDGVFSMDGDIAPLDDYLPVVNQHEAVMLVDDAHGLGVLGETGRGCKEHFNLDAQQLPILMGTFGKGFGTAGAFVASSKTVAESFTQFARPYIYTTAMPPALAYTTHKSLTLLQQDAERRQRLQRNIQLFRDIASDKGLPLMPSITAIQPVLLKQEQACIDCAAYLKQHGFWVGAIRPPTVANGSARLRITLNADHQPSDIERLVACLSQWWRTHRAYE